MNECEALKIAEDPAPVSEPLYLAAYQYLVDTGLAWKLTESIGREAARLLEVDKIKPGKLPEP